MKMAKALFMALGATVLAVGVQYYLYPETPGWAVGILFAVLMNILTPVLYLIERMKVLKDGWEYIQIKGDPYAELAKKFEDVEYAPASPDIRGSSIFDKVARDMAKRDMADADNAFRSGNTIAPEAADSFHVHTCTPSGLDAFVTGKVIKIMEKAHDEAQEYIRSITVSGTGDGVSGD